jgi:hypothetical protein
MGSATVHEKEKFRQQVTQQVSGRRGGKGRPNSPSAAWPSRKTKPPRPSGTERPKENLETPAPSRESTKQDTDNAVAAPSAAGPG